MKLLISGHTSLIAQELEKILKEKYGLDLDIMRVGRHETSDFLCDLGEFSSIKNFIEKILNKEHFDFVFLNHGILLGKKALELSESEARDYMMINCFSTVAILEAFTTHKNTNIVVTSSISAKEGSYDPMYASTKAGVDSFRLRAGSSFDSSVRLNFVSPGVIGDASMTTRRKDQNNVNAIELSTPTRNLTNSYEIANLVSYLLLSPGNIHCQDFGINGGKSLNR